MKVEARKSDLYDPKPVIQYAYNKAEKSDKPWYVEPVNGKFAAVEVQPGVRCSHWRVLPNGDLSAHMGGQEITEYNYEEV